MAYKGKVQLTFIITAPPDQVEEGDRIFESHALRLSDAKANLRWLSILDTFYQPFKSSFWW